MRVRALQCVQKCSKCQRTIHAACGCPLFCKRPPRRTAGMRQHLRALLAREERGSVCTMTDLECFGCSNVHRLLRLHGADHHLVVRERGCGVVLGSGKRGALREYVVGRTERRERAWEEAGVGRKRGGVSVRQHEM